MAIFELRTYTLKVSKVQDYLELYHREAMAIHTGHLGQPVGWWQSEIGVLNQIVMLWRYESLADREQRRATLMEDPAWLAFLPKTADYIERMETRILKAAFFSPMH